jgi:hypothetical protein
MFPGIRKRVDPMKSELLFVIGLCVFAGCGRADNLKSAAEEQSSNNVPSEPEDDPKTDTQLWTESDSFPAVVSKQSFANTGIKAEVLLGFLNTNKLLEMEFHHEFRHVNDNGDVSIYKDIHSELIIVLVGPKDDLLCIEMSMPVEAFVGLQPDGTMNADGAAAFGRCVQRIGAAIDPSWTEDLYSWFNSRFQFALLAQRAYLTYKHFLVTVDSDTLPNGTRILNFCVGIPERSGDESAEGDVDSTKRKAG